ncbi:MAG TPA: adenine phosphoribosyltransferase [Coriobacteriia bacterium]
MDLESYIRDIPDFPKPGILFKDITPLLADAGAFRESIDRFHDAYADEGVTVVMGAEARGFILGGALAYRLGAGFVPARKPGKLPWNVTKAEYALEYGTDSLEIHEDAVKPDDVVLIIDDVLATGGTANAKAKLVESKGGRVAGFAFLLELDALKGREKLGDRRIVTLIHTSD